MTRADERRAGGGAGYAAIGKQSHHDFVLVGGGQIASAIRAHFGRRCHGVPLSSKLFSSACAPAPFPTLPLGRRPIIYCFGPAGDAAVRVDPAGAVLAHVVLPTMFRERNPGAPFIYVSSLLSGAPTWYGMLKAMGEAAVQTDGHGLHLLRLGAVLDPEHRRGVASRFFWQARMRRFPLRVPASPRTVAVVSMPLVLRAVEIVTSCQLESLPLISEIGYPIMLRDLAHAVAGHVTRGLVTVAGDPDLPSEPDYGPVRNPLFRLPPLERVLADWARAGMRRSAKEGAARGDCGDPPAGILPAAADDPEARQRGPSRVPGRSGRDV